MQLFRTNIVPVAAIQALWLSFCLKPWLQRPESLHAEMRRELRESFQQFQPHHRRGVSPVLSDGVWWFTHLIWLTALCGQLMP